LKQKLRAAIIDLYNNEANEGMRCIKEILLASNQLQNEAEVSYDAYETRYIGDIPDLSYDIFISSGGPGSPFEGEGTLWEKSYFDLLDDIWNHNQKNDRKKYVFFICHSFQIMARYFNFAEVNKRHKKSFGVFPFGLTEEGKNDKVFSGLSNPFYAADFRQWQVINPNTDILNQLGAKILSIEIKEQNPDGDLALMSVRVSDEFFGTQFHPEADPESMMYHFKQDERKQHIVSEYGEAKYFEMIEQLEKPEFIKLTRKTVLPSFLLNAINELTKI